MARRGPDSSRRFRPINTSREAPPAAGQAETREQADPRLLREIGSFRIQLSGALPAGTIVEVIFHGEAAAPASQTPRQQGGRRHRWRDIPAPRSDAPAGAEGNRIRWRDIPVPRTDPPAAERERQPRWRDLPADPAPPTAEEQLLARHPEWEPLTPEDIRDRRDALDIFETLRLVPEESLQASRRNRGELVRQLGWAIGALHTRLAGTAPRRPHPRRAPVAAAG